METGWKMADVGPNWGKEGKNMSAQRHGPLLADRVRLLRFDCLRLGQLLDAQIRRHSKECGRRANESKEANGWLEAELASTALGGGGREEGAGREGRLTNLMGNGPEEVAAQKRGPVKTGRSKAVQSETSWATPKVEIGHFQSAQSVQKEKPWSRAHFSAGLRDSRPVPTVPRPFRLSQRAPISCTFAERHLRQMLEEKERMEGEAISRPFRAKSVPASAYRPDQSHWIGQIKFRERDAIRARANSFSTLRIRPLPIAGQPLPLSTYLRPSRSLAELRTLRRQRKSVERMLAQSRAPLGLEEHSLRWRVQYRLRHSRRCLASPPPRPIFHAQTVPDFQRLQVEFEQNLAASRRIRPSTVPMPFRLTRRDYYGDDGQLRGHSCENWMDKDRRAVRSEREGWRKQNKTEGKPKWR